MATTWERRNDGIDRMAQALGWFSLGLGVAEVVAPRGMARLIGLADTAAPRPLLQAFGLREIASGAGILRGRRQAGWLWSRVLGDVIDLAVLGRARSGRGVDRTRLASVTAAVTGVTALDLAASARATRRARAPIHVRKCITIDRSPADLYERWHDLTKLPGIMRHLESVEVTGPRHSRWRANGPAGTTIEWEAETVDDQPDRRIAWESVANATVPNRGAVEFDPAPGNRGTILRVDLQYDPPGGAAGAAIAKLFGKEPSQQIGEDLRRFKQLVETGEVATGQSPSARRRPSLYDQPTQPARA
jgi:uncharacterized membrane protein